VEKSTDRETVSQLCAERLNASTTQRFKECQQIMHLLFYADGSGYGGHEMTTLRAVRQLLRLPGVRIGFMSHVSNTRLNAELERLQADSSPFERYTAPFATRSVQGVRTQLARGAVTALARQFQTINPDVVVPVQGSIEISSLGLMAARQARVATISYIPYAHTLRQTRAPLARLRDALNHRLFRLPHGFITCCQSAAGSLRANGVSAPVEVVYHSVDVPERVSRQEARRRLELKVDSYVAAIVGRVYLKQKGHDLLIKALNRHADRLGDMTLLIVGDGPDLEAVRRLAGRSQITERVRFVAWRADLSDIYSAIDLLLLPSYYEGLPATMLEALQVGVPVIASDRDGMAEVLPAEWRFATGDPTALAATLLRVKGQDVNRWIGPLQTRITAQFDAKTFGARFLAALDHLCGRTRGV
jgi:glycosyltransferase involved in cell wall biosynthesis